MLAKFLSLLVIQVDIKFHKLWIFLLNSFT